MTHTQAWTASGRRVPWHAVPLGTAALLVLVASDAIATLTPAGSVYVLAALLGFLPVAVIVTRLAARHPLERGFGAANWTTLLRGCVTALTAGLIAAPAALSGRPALAWVPTLIAVLGLVLDVADGRLARRGHLETAFGARFDVEVDAWTTLVLAALAVALGAAPAWVLTIGLAHYLFRAAGLLLPALAVPLPPSLRRRILGGLQPLALAALLAPTLPAPTASAIAGTALAALLLSFALDVRWLARPAAPQSRPQP